MANQRYNFNAVMKSTAAISGLTLMAPDEIRKRIWETAADGLVELDCIDQFDKPVHVSFRPGTVDALMIMEANLSALRGQQAPGPGPGLLRT